MKVEAQKHPEKCRISEKAKRSRHSIFKKASFSLAGNKNLGFTITNALAKSTGLPS
jgi:hypothetical protein